MRADIADLTAASAELTGGCACGSVLYRLVGPPIFATVCFCSLCRRQSGGASAAHLAIEADRFTPVGAISYNLIATGSGRLQRVARCSECGSAVWSRMPGLGDGLTVVRAGTLDAPDAIRMDAAIWVADRIAWAAVPTVIPAFEGAFEPDGVLGRTNLDRLCIALARG